jgi:hypothetical protein
MSRMRRRKKEKIGLESHVRTLLMHRYKGRRTYVGSGAAAAIQLSGTLSLAEDTSPGTVIGTFSVTNGSGTYTFAITADPSSKFEIGVGGTTLELNELLDYDAAASHSVTIEADNGVDDPIQRGFVIVVTDVNHAPTVASAIPNQSAPLDTLFTFQFASGTFEDEDAQDVLVYTATLDDNSALPAWLTFTAATRTFSGTPTASDEGIIAVKVTASDGSLSVTDTFGITVGEPAAGEDAGLLDFSNPDNTINAPFF